MLGFVRNWIFIIFTLLAAGLLGESRLAGQDRGQSPPKAPAKPTADELAIRANVAAFVKAFNVRDAKAVARLFVPEAQIVDEEGNTTQGRDAIEKGFAGTFADAKQARMDVSVESIRFIGSALAVETGVTKVIEKPGAPPEANRYTAVHIKPRGGQWMMAFVRDTPQSEVTNYERLRPLEWMIGEWVDESHDSIVATSCKWSPNKNYILGEIKIRMQGHDAMDLTQRIGWDPLTKQIKSWVFDSEGGYAESFWAQDGNRWFAKANAVRADGTTASATNIFTPTAKDSYTWQSTDRIAGGKMQPPVVIKIVRKPPEPAVAR